jgi:hypothetical protein
MDCDIKIPQLPLEMIWSILRWCDFPTSKSVVAVFDFDIQIAYRYHLYQPVGGSNFEEFEHINTLCLNSVNFNFLARNDLFVSHFTPDQLLIFAAGMGDMSTFVRFLPLSDPSYDSNLACRLASSHGNTAILKLLLNDHRVDPSDQENYSLKSASQKGYTEIVNLLLNDHRVDPSSSDNFAVGVASILGHVEIVKALLKHDRLSLPNEFWALRYAFMKGHTVIVGLLCNHLGSDVNLWK